MPYKEHERLKTPADKNIIWRYMDFTKFVAMLDGSSLYFSSATKLREQDPGEASFCHFISKKLKQHMAKNNQLKNNIVKPLLHDLNATLVYVNCWHLSDCESAALWKLYSKGDDVITIKSSVGKLKKAISKCPENVNICKVIYDPQKSGYMKSENINRKSYDLDDAITCKRPSFKHEKELRLFVTKFNLDNNSKVDNYGLKVKTNLNALISKVVVSPQAPLWICDLIERISQHYDYSFDISKSTLNETPF